MSQREVGFVRVPIVLVQAKTTSRWLATAPVHIDKGLPQDVQDILLAAAASIIVTGRTKQWKLKRCDRVISL